MSEPLALLNGETLPLSQVRLAVWDGGFLQGTTVAEQLRTFRGRLFRGEQHLARLAHSLEIVGVAPPQPLSELGAALERLAAHNHALLDAEDDLGLTVFVTPGPYPSYAAALGPELVRPGPVLCAHTAPLPYAAWRTLYEDGQPLMIAGVRQVPAACWPRELKCRSRMHYYLADQEARRREPGARAILLDLDGAVSEASTANLLVYRRDEGLLSPPPARILPGVSLEMAAELAAELGIPFVRRELYPADLYAADELLLTNTSPCIVPAVRIDGRPVGDGRPGEVFARLLAAWGARVGVDLRRQALRDAAPRG